LRGDEGGELRGCEFGDVGEEVDDCAGEPVALVGRVRAAPVVLDCEGEGRPEVEGDGYAALEAGLDLCYKEGMLER